MSLLLSASLVGCEGGVAGVLRLLLSCEVPINVVGFGISGALVSVEGTTEVLLAENPNPVGLATIGAAFAVEGSTGFDIGAAFSVEVETSDGF